MDSKKISDPFRNRVTKCGLFGKSQWFLSLSMTIFIKKSFTGIFICNSIHQALLILKFMNIFFVNYALNSEGHYRMDFLFYLNPESKNRDA
jgi:hypothetical protein